MSQGHPYGTGWAILPQVSRSFAMVIRWLPRPIDDTVMTAYLLCRLADTIEDSALPPDERRRLLHRFSECLDAGPAGIPVAGVSDPYRDLVLHADEVLQCYRALPEVARSVLRIRVTEMCRGMSKWCGREIVTLADQNDYCYYVAGLVGLLLTDVFRAFDRISEGHAAVLRPLAADFGLALQKVNILRDVGSDLAEKRCYWPTEILARQGLTPATLLHPQNRGRALAVMRELIRDQWTYLNAALRYLTHLPIREARLRIFCAVPLFMAVATVRRCEENPAVFQTSQPVKIPRSWTKSIVMRAFTLGTSNDYLRSWFRRWHRGELNRPSPWYACAALLP